MQRRQGVTGQLRSVRMILRVHTGLPIYEYHPKAVGKFNLLYGFLGPFVLWLKCCEDVVDYRRIFKVLFN